MIAYLTYMHAYVNFARTQSSEKQFLIPTKNVFRTVGYSVLRTPSVRSAFNFEPQVLKSPCERILENARKNAREKKTNRKPAFPSSPTMFSAS